VNTLVDTQVLSYYFKGFGDDIRDDKLTISSITANEFLLAQSTETNEPDYYVLDPARYVKIYAIPEHYKNPKWIKMGKRRTDQIIIDFGNQFLPYREFGSKAISGVINKKLLSLYALSISHLQKQKQKYLMKRLEYITNKSYYCYPLNKLIIDRGLYLFSRFINEYNCKGNIHNTVNDILILATAITHKTKFLTYDKLLNRFASEYYNIPIYNEEDKLLIDFSSHKSLEKSKNEESKGYINRGWSYSFYNKTVM